MAQCPESFDDDVDSEIDEFPMLTGYLPSINDAVIFDEFPDNIDNFDTVKQLIESGTPIDKKYGMFEETLLHRAFATNSIETVKYLLEHGANINAQDANKRTILHLIRNHTIETVDYLIKSGADLHAVDCETQTPLHLVSERCYFAMVKYFVESGAVLNALDYTDRTPLHSALSCPRMTFSTKIPPNMPGSIQIDADQIKTIEYLVESGSDINICDHRTGTPLHYAVHHPIGIVKYLLDRGADKSLMDIEDLTADAHADRLANRCTGNNNFHEIAEFIRSYDPTPTKGVHCDHDDV